MAMPGVDFKWYDGFFLSMLATSIIIVSINWKRYNLCVHPLHIWIVVDYAIVFIFRLLMFLDNGLAAGMGVKAPVWRLFQRCVLGYGAGDAKVPFDDESRELVLTRRHAGAAPQDQRFFRQCFSTT